MSATAGAGSAAATARRPLPGSAAATVRRPLGTSEDVRQLVDVHGLGRLVVDDQHFLAHGVHTRLVEGVGMKRARATQVWQHHFTDGARCDPPGYPANLAREAPVGIPMHPELSAAAW